MRCPRSIAFAVLAAFAVKAAVPAPVLVTHHHEGGEHEHVHAEALPWHHHDDADHHELGDPHHHHDDAAPVPRGPGIRLADTDGGHAHWQLPFQRLAPTTCSTVFCLHALRRVSLPAPTDPPTAPVPAARSRGPPAPGAAE